MSDHTLYVNAERTILLTIWDSGTVELATRDHPSAVWGPPVLLVEEPPYELTGA